MTDKFFFAGRYYGNCGWSSVNNKESAYLRREFHHCSSEQDKFCGLLQCQHDGEYNIDKQIRILNFALVKFSHKTDGGVCDSAAFDVGKC